MAGRRTGVTGRGALAFMAGVLAGVAAFVLGIAVIAVPLGSSEQAGPETGQPAGAVTGRAAQAGTDLRRRGDEVPPRRSGALDRRGHQRRRDLGTSA
jgi:hypothetical protein